MRKTLVVVASLLLLFAPFAADAQDSKAALAAVAKALGADGVTSLEYSGSGHVWAVGQSGTPGTPWPKFGATVTRAVNYDTGALREQLTRTQVDPPRGGGNQPVRGQLRSTFFLRGDHAWNLVGDAAVPAPVGLAERSFQLWTTPHGIVKAALAGKGSMTGRTITVAVPGRFKAEALVNAQNLIEKVNGTVAHAVLGDMPIEITYADYKAFGGVQFPTKITQTAGRHPSVDLTISDVQPTATVDVPVPGTVEQSPNPYARVTTQMMADGVWYLTGGSHHSVVIEMKDSVIVVEGPLTEERAMAVIVETRNLVPAKPIRYVIATHHHFDHSGGLRAFAAVNVPVIVQESAKDYMERALSTAATVNPDRLAKSGLKPSVEGVRAKRVITDGTRVVEIHHIAGNAHADDLLMVYLPKEKLLVEADVFTPLAAGVAPPTPPSPYTVAFADQVSKLKLAVDQILPIHGRAVPLAELNKTLGKP